jgi:hypothetical protein
MLCLYIILLSIWSRAHLVSTSVFLFFFFFCSISRFSHVLGFVTKNYGLTAGAIAGLAIGLIAIVSLIVFCLSLSGYLAVTRGESEVVHL